MTDDKYLLQIKTYPSADSNNAICQVIAKYDSNIDNKIVIDSDNLLDEFNNSKTVYVPKLDSNKYKEKEFIQLTIKEIFNDGANPRIHHNSVRAIKHSYCVDLKTIQINNLSVNYNALQIQIIPKYNMLDKPFYISDGSKTYGRFKIENNKVIAEKGIEVNCYEPIQFIKIDYPDTELQGISVILNTPDSIQTIYDYSSDIQIIDYTKEIIEKSKLDDETRKYINIIKKLLSPEGQDELEKARIKRTQNLLDKIILKYDEFVKLRDNSSFWKNVFDNSIHNYEAKLKENYLSKQKQILDDELEDNRNNVKKLKCILDGKQRELNSMEETIVHNQKLLKNTEKQITIIQDKKDELLIMLEIQSKLAQKNINNPSRHFEIQNPVNNNTDSFMTINDVVSELEDQIGLTKFTKELEGELRTTIGELKDYNYFTCKEIKDLLGLLHLMGSNSIYLTNVEADWIKFDKLSQNGLKAAFDEAYKSADKTIYFILQDFNLASPECYAKPLLDLNRKFRQTYPNDLRGWPDNLSIIFIPLEIQTEEFGFEINTKTFNNWKELTPPQLEYSRLKLSKVINLAAII